VKDKANVSSSRFATADYVINIICKNFIRVNMNILKCD